MSGDPTPRSAARRLVLDNLPVFLWVGFLQPVALAIWGSETPFLLVAALAVGQLAALGLFVLPAIAGPSATGRAAEAAEQPSALERRARLIAHAVLFAASAHLALAYLVKLLGDLGVPRGVGFSGLSSDSVGMYLGFVTFWAVSLSLLVERLAPWVRELLKIERHVLLLFAVGLPLAILGGLSPRATLGPGTSPPGGFLSLAGYSFAITLLLSPMLETWCPAIRSPALRRRTAGVLFVGVPVGIGLLIALLAGDESGAGPTDPVPVPGWRIPMGDVDRMHGALAGLVPNRWARALLDLTFCLGSIGICVYLGLLAMRELPLSFRWPARVLASLGLVAVAGAVLASGALGDLPRTVITLACAIVPIVGTRWAGVGVQRAALALGAVATGVAWSALGPSSWFGEIGRGFAPLFPVAILAICRAAQAVESGRRNRSAIAESSVGNLKS